MKLSELTEAQKTKKKPKKPKKRPAKDLWFRDQALWHMDLRREMGGLFDIVTDENEEEGDVFATNQDRSKCYGVWRKKLGRGITFKQPRPLHTIAHPRLNLGTFLTGQGVPPKQDIGGLV